MKWIKKILSVGLILIFANACYYIEASSEKTDIQVGDTVGVNVWVVERVFNVWGKQIRRGAEDIYGVAFELGYDPAILNFVEAQNLGGLANSDVMTAFRNSTTDNGQLVIGISKSGQEQGNETPMGLVRIVFQAISSGTAEITIRDDHLINSKGETGFNIFPGKGKPKGCAINVQ